MVIATPATDRDRGQLVLIGAISIAFILLGVVVVFNGVQYTETVNNGGAGSDLSEVRTIESELQTGIEALDANGEGIDEDLVEEYVEDLYHPSRSHQGPVHVTFKSWDSTSSPETVKVTITTTDTTVTRTIEVDI